MCVCVFRARVLRPNNNFGGGRVELNVSQGLAVTGTVSASAVYATGHHGAGSGGSVLIHTDGLSGDGVIRADGTTARATGTGGRVAVYVHPQRWVLGAGAWV